MPNKKNAEKALRQSKKRQIANDKVRFSIHDMKRKIRKALETNVSIEELQGLYKQAQILLDKATKSDVIKKNTAARKKASIANMINKKAKSPATESATKKTTTKKAATKKTTTKKAATKKTTTKKTTTKK